MKIAAFAFHPNFGQSRVVRTWADALELDGIEVRRYSGDDLDPGAEQARCDAADAILLVHPFHWYGNPWPMKRWIDEVLTYGWAYGGPDRLSGKPWMHAVSVGAPQAEYTPEGSRRYSVEEFMRPFERTAAFCRAEYRSPFLSYGTGLMDEAQIGATAKELRLAVRRWRG